jgi:hypothetical protein
MPSSFDVYLLEDGSLMVGRPKGVLDGELATKIIEFVEIKEALIETGFQSLLRYDATQRRQSRIQ